MLRPLPARAAIALAAITLAALPSLLLSAPAFAQKQDYPDWVYQEMVPTGPYLRNLDQAQPVPGARPSHWGSIGKDGQFRAGMSHYGTDAKASSPSYSRTHSLTPPPVSLTPRSAPQTGGAPPAPRAVQID